MPREAGLWLVSYDIADPRRLGQLARRMEKRGLRIQYSVFAVQSKTVEIPGLKEEIGTIIDPRNDDVRFYPIAGHGRSMVLGASLISPDMLPHHPAFQQLRLPLRMEHSQNIAGQALTNVPLHRKILKDTGSRG